MKTKRMNPVLAWACIYGGEILRVRNPVTWIYFPAIFPNKRQCKTYVHSRIARVRITEVRGKGK